MDSIIKELIKDERLNVFDVIVDEKKHLGFKVITYRRPGESDNDFFDREARNFAKAVELKTKKPR